MPYPLNKTVSRESHGFVREAGKTRQVIIILQPPNLIGFRAKGCRKVYHLTSDACYSLAVKAELAAARREKMQAKKQTRTTRR